MLPQRSALRTEPAPKTEMCHINVRLPMKLAAVPRMSAVRTHTLVRHDGAQAEKKRHRCSVNNVQGGGGCRYSLSGYVGEAVGVAAS